MKVARFEFFLINSNIELGKINEESSGLKKITGVNWGKLARLLEKKFKFVDFNFKEYNLEIFKNTAPQYLVKSESGQLKWDSDDKAIDSWEILLSRGFAQLRNNIAHGNKAHISSAFTQTRTEEFIESGHCLMNFIAKEIFNVEHWASEIVFKS